MKLSNFKQNVAASTDGVLVDIGDGFKLRIARMGNKKYQDELKRLTKPYKRAMKNDTLADSVYEELYNKAMAEAVLLGWEGLSDDAGEEIAYSKEKALELLSDPAYEDFKTLVIDLANEQETFRSQDIEDTVGE